MSEIFDTVLLLALPASGKSEVRKFLRSLPAEECAREFHMGPTVQLDDFPYVHLMRRIDLALDEVDKPPIFFAAPDKSFKEPRDWGTLIELVNEDYHDLVEKRVIQPDSPASYLLERLDNARRKVGVRAALAALDDETRDHVCAFIEAEAIKHLADKHANYPKTLNGKTLVIEFARGGPAEAAMPLPPPLGYGYSLARLVPEILERAVILYIWVTAEESRRKNEERADPQDPGSILHHSVPREVMLRDYGCDDIDWLLSRSGQSDAIKVEVQGEEYFLPIGRFDNRVDKTSFLRQDKRAWKPAHLAALREALKATLDRLYQRATEG